MNPRSFLAFVLACLLALSATGIAAAHAELVESDPADGESVATPATLTALFSEPLSDEGSSIRVSNAAGAEVASGGVDPTDDLRMLADLPALPDGEYVARWTVRDEDGHVTRGEIRFTVEAASTPEPPTPASAPATDPPATAPPTDQPTPSPSPPPSPSPSPPPIDEQPTGGVGDVLMALVLAGAVIGGLTLYLLRRR